MNKELQKESLKYRKKIKQIYSPISHLISSRLEDFTRIWEYGSDRDIFVELVFCLLTPQSKAKSCWGAVENITQKKLLFTASAEKIAQNLTGVRFHNNKSTYIIEAREKFYINKEIKIKNHLESLGNTFNKREWLVKNIKGMGYKEASHFLRNIGFGKDIAILDRHILKNLKLLGVINEFPKSITKEKYYEIENLMREFSKEIKIPMDHLDILLWYQETGEIFK